MIVSIHQCDLLPNSRFWWKLANSDVMDLRIDAQIVERGYQRRIMMREQWVNLVLAGDWKYLPIREVHIDNKASRKQLINVVRGRYNNAAYRKGRLDELCDAINAQESDLLWEFNKGLLDYIRDTLGITTPFNITGPAEGAKGEGVLSIVQRYPGADTYLSGTGAKKYMSDTSAFEAAGVQVSWSRHIALTNDSIVSVLMDHENPIELVMLEESDELV